MKNPTTDYKRLLATAATGMFLITGCWQDPSAPESDDGLAGGATIEGQVTGEMSLAKRASSSWAPSRVGLEGATVTVVRLKADGSLETVSKGEVKTDAKGRFSLETTAEAAHGLIVVAKKEGREFKAVVSGEVKKGSRTLCRPVDVESSIEAEVYAKVHSEGKGGTVSFADIASHVDAQVATKVDARAEGKTEGIAFLAAQMETEAEIRASVLMNGTGRFTRAQLEKMDQARIEAQAALEASLHAAARTEAGLTAEARVQAEGQCLKSHWKAAADAGIALGEFAKAREAAFRAMVRTHTEAAVDSGTRAAWLKSIALQNAFSLEAALVADAAASGGDPALLALVAEAGASLKLSLQTAGSVAEADTAFSRCRQAVASGIRSSLEGTLGAWISLADSSRARAAFDLSLKSAATAEAVAEAYTRFYAAAEAEIKAALPETFGQAGIEAATRAALLLNLQGRAAGTQGGSTLSGSVEGDLSGADVRIALVKPDGSLEILPGAEVETDAEGGFRISVSDPIPENTVVVITKDTATLTALVEAGADSVRVGTETTAEIRVYQKALLEGRTAVTVADIKAQVDSQMAVSILGDDSMMVSLLASMDAASKAQADFLAGSGGLAGTSLMLLSVARSSAQARLEFDLKAAAGDTARIRAAYDAYHGAVTEAYVKAGLDAAAYARSMQVYAQAMDKSSLRLSEEARTMIIRSSHSQACRGLRSALEIQMKAAGSSEAAVKALVEAGVALQASVDHSSRMEAIEAAYETYHAAVVASLRGAFLLHATAISAADGRIREAGGARAVLMASIKAETGSYGISKAHAEFASQVESEVSEAFPGGVAGPSSAQVKVIAQVLILANMCG